MASLSCQRFSSEAGSTFSIPLVCSSLRRFHPSLYTNRHWGDIKITTAGFQLPLTRRGNYLGRVGGMGGVSVTGLRSIIPDTAVFLHTVVLISGAEIQVNHGKVKMSFHQNEERANSYLLSSHNCFLSMV